MQFFSKEGIGKNFIVTNDANKMFNLSISTTIRRLSHTISKDLKYHSLLYTIKNRRKRSKADMKTKIQFSSFRQEDCSVLVTGTWVKFYHGHARLRLPNLVFAHFTILNYKKITHLHVITIPYIS